jgi:hypothetical protein
MRRVVLNHILSALRTSPEAPLATLANLAAAWNVLLHVQTVMFGEVIAPVNIPAACQIADSSPPVSMLQYMYYNFCRIHKSLRIMPAKGAGVIGCILEI